MSGPLEQEAVEENMATNLLNDLFGINPMGVFYNFAAEYPKFAWGVENPSKF